MPRLVVFHTVRGEKSTRRTSRSLSSSGRDAAFGAQQPSGYLAAATRTAPSRQGGLVWFALVDESEQRTPQGLWSDDIGSRVIWWMADVMSFTSRPNRLPSGKISKARTSPESASALVAAPRCRAPATNFPRGRSGQRYAGGVARLPARIFAWALSLPTSTICLRFSVETDGIEEVRAILHAAYGRKERAPWRADARGGAGE